MPRKTVTMVAFLFFVFLILSVQGNALAASSSAVVPLKQKCNHLLITLHGKANADILCQDNKIGPQIVQTTCPGSIMLFWDANFSGGTICFSGSGSTDLTAYCAPWNGGGCFNTWNDSASAYTKNDSNAYIRLYEDVGDEGRYLVADSGPHSLGSGSWNDRISSVCINVCY